MHGSRTQGDFGVSGTAHRDCSFRMKRHRHRHLIKFVSKPRKERRPPDPLKDWADPASPLGSNGCAVVVLVVKLITIILTMIMLIIKIHNNSRNKYKGEK